MRQHSDELRHLINETIDKHGGWIGFDQYMQMALYEPGLGYYAAGSQKFGVEGDFVTAPTIGQLFAYCIANQCEEVLKLEGCDSILEFGAGTGDLAAQILQNLAERNQLPNRYQIVETSADLRARQESCISELGSDMSVRVEWLDTIPPSISGIVIANELIDAMPFKRFEIADGGQCVELGVTLKDQNLGWQRGSSLDLPDFFTECAQGYQSEWCPQAAAWVNTVAERLQRGLILLIDYGFPDFEFYHPDRDQGTLMCHYRHHAHSDPFFWPGLQDITSHVDFSALARAGKNAGLELLGYCTQGDFLISSGILECVQKRIEQSSNDEEEKQIHEQLSLAAEVKKLTLPHEMGELFKVMAMARGIQQIPNGFTRSNKRHRLLND
ncbi:MAG: SAM-dependent methyltransferase [Acidiferrobacterales bacterium]|nr:SAM-dependent methyltransferase [Acidiferrobacterales bacterium]